MRPNAVKRAMKAGQAFVGTWLSLASITAARFMARSGLDWLTVDIEHSLCDWETAAHIFASVAMPARWPWRACRPSSRSH